MARWRVYLVLLCMVALPMSAQARQVSISYDMFAGGLHALTATLTITRSSPEYAIRAELDTQGFIDFLVRWRSEQRSEGALRDHRAVPNLHTRDGEWRFQNRSTRLTYQADGDVEATIEPPPEADDRTPVSPAQRRGTIDLLSLVVQGAYAPDAATACQGKAEIFDGRRRYDVGFTAAGWVDLKPQEYGSFGGKALHCRVQLTPVAGFRPDTEEETGLGLPEGISVWLTDDANTGIVVPVRFEAEIPFGRLIGHVTKVAATP